MDLARIKRWWSLKIPDQHLRWARGGLCINYERMQFMPGDLPAGIDIPWLVICDPRGSSLQVTTYLGNVCILPLEPVEMTSYVAFRSISPGLILSLLLPLPCIAIESVLGTYIYVVQHTSTFQHQKPLSLTLAKTQRCHCLNLVEYKWHPNDWIFFTQIPTHKLTSRNVGNAKKGRELGIPQINS